jgi:hypothetical protein
LETPRETDSSDFWSSSAWTENIPGVSPADDWRNDVPDHFERYFDRPTDSSYDQLSFLDCHLRCMFQSILIERPIIPTSTSASRYISQIKEQNRVADDKSSLFQELRIIHLETPSSTVWHYI